MMRKRLAKKKIRFIKNIYPAKRIGYKKRTMEAKIQILVVFSIISISVLMLFLMSFWITITMQDKTIRLMSAQVKNSATSITYVLDSCNATLRTLEIDSNVQTYLKEDQDGNYPTNANPVNRVLTTATVNYDYIYGVTLIRYGNQSYSNVSDQASAADAQFLSNMLDNYKQAHSMQIGSVVYNLQNMQASDVTTFNIYRPVSDSVHLMKQIGLLCIRINCEDLQKYYTLDVPDLTMCLVNDQGEVVLSDTEENAVTKIKKEYLAGNSGSFVIGQKTYVYDKLDNYKFYMVGIMGAERIYQDIVHMLLAMLLITICIIAVMLKLTNSLVKQINYPLKKLMDGMKSISTGYLQVEIQKEEYGEDIRELLSGFNFMARQIEMQRKQILEEEEENRKNELLALQEQIKPHFLYNTLDCIHWQALAQGNQMVSRMIQALAKFYRICLNNGEEVISLDLEIEHIKNYLFIQNMRFDKEIMMEINIPERLMQAEIPKLTMQPLIENAIYHGIHIKNRENGTILITARELGHYYEIHLSDSGNEMTLKKIEEMNNSLEKKNMALGYGLYNVHRKIQLLCGKEYGIHFTLSENSGLEVIISLPTKIE